MLLASLPVVYVKVDAQFIASAGLPGHAAGPDRHLAMVRHLVTQARGFGVLAVAEGVEDGRQC